MSDYNLDVHPFQAAGLGQAPFRYTGVTKNVFVAAPGVPGKPGGSCDYCSTGIMYEFWIESADAKRFKVGCDCVKRLASADNRLVSQVEQAERKLKREMALAKKTERDAKATTRSERRSRWSKATRTVCAVSYARSRTRAFQTRLC